MIHNIKNIKSKWLKVSSKLNELNTKIKEIGEFLNSHCDIIDKYESVESKIKEHYKQEEEYNKYTNVKKIQEQWCRLTNDKRIQQYLFDTVSNDIVYHDIFLNKISESESISLTNCIDTINYYINDYLEKFFPTDSMIVDIVPFKEKEKKCKTEKDKSEIKPGIDIKVCYNVIIIIKCIDMIFVIFIINSII